MNQRLLLFYFLTFFLTLNCSSQDHDYLKRNMEIDQIFSTVVSHEGKYGLVENKSGNTVLPIEYDTIISCTTFQCVYIFSKADQYGFALLIFDVEEWMYHWEIFEPIYDTVYYKTAADPYVIHYLVRKKDNQYDFLRLDHGVIWNPYRSVRNYETSYTIEQYYTSQNTYDTLFITAGKTEFASPGQVKWVGQRLIYGRDNKFGLHYFNKETDCELPCLWDSVTYDPIKHKDYVWKDGKFAILFIHWAGDLGWRLGEANNFVLSTPYAFTNKDEFDIDYHLDLGSQSSVVFVIQHGKPFKIYIDYGSKETIFHYADGSPLLVDTNFTYNIIRNDSNLLIDVVLKQRHPFQESNEINDNTFLCRNKLYFATEDGKIEYSLTDLMTDYEIIDTDDNGCPSYSGLIIGRLKKTRNDLGWEDTIYREVFRIYDIKSDSVLWEVQGFNKSYYLDNETCRIYSIRYRYIDYWTKDIKKIGYIAYNKKGLKVCRYKWIANWFYSDVPVEKP